MVPKSCLPILVFFLIICVNIFSVAYAQSNFIALTVSIPGEQQRNVSDSPVLVSGVWHYINISLDQSTSMLSLIFYQGENLPVIKNETNYYEWEYYEAAPSNWEDKQYGIYIQTTNCSKTNNMYSFYLGIDQIATIGNWTLEIISDSIEIHNTNIFVEQKIFSPGISYPDNFGLQAEPFTESTVSSETSDLHLSLENNGNIPLIIDISYSQFSDRVILTNLENILHPFSKTTNYVTVNSLDTWRSGKIFIDASITLTGQHLILTGTVVLPEKLEETFTIPILIGHSNYELFESTTSDITFQYEKQLTAEFDEIKNIITYIGGSGNVNITVNSLDATLLKVTHNENEIADMPFLVHSTNTTEQKIITRIHFNKENTTASIIYELEINGELKTFTTNIDVRPRLPKEEEPPDTTLIMVFIGICIIAVIVYMIYNQIKYRKK